MHNMACQIEGITRHTHYNSAIIYHHVTQVEEITPEQSSLSLTTSLKLFITQIHDRGFSLIGPRQVHAEYKMHTCKTIYMLVLHVQFSGRLATIKSATELYM